MNRKKVVFLLFFAAWLLAACGGRASQQPDRSTITIDLDATSTDVGPTTLQIRVREAGGAAVEGATLDVRGDMNHAGMVPVLAEGITENEAGVYSVPFEWTMGGVWIVTVTATLPDGETTAQQFNVSVGSSGGEMDMEGTP